VRPRRGAVSLSGSPVLVGAVTVLITIIAVFLSYNANTGLPFVPTYDLHANLPNAAQLVRGNDVRIGGARVGAVSTITPERRSDGSTYARLELKLDKSVQPLPADSTMIVRPRSTLGLKYLEIVPGKSRQSFDPGSTIPIARATPKNVELDDVFNMFNARTRRGSQNTLQGLGNGFAGRGPSLNTAIAEFRPLLDDLQPVAKNLASPRTQLGRLFRSLGSAASETAPVAEEQAALFRNMDVTFTALASIARPFLQESISESPPTEDVAIHDFPLQRPFLRNSAAFFHELRPGVATLPSSAPLLADALVAGTRELPKTPPLNRKLADVFDSVQALNDDPLAVRGIKQLSRFAVSLKPTLAFVTPAQVRCNYGTLWFRNISDLLSEGDTNGTWQRFIQIATPQGPNNEGGPSSAPANGPGDNYLHSNPYPNTAGPGQTPECEAGNEHFIQGRKVIGNVPGNQGLRTAGQK
jgi:virulence factor Mce-like protein